MTRPLSRREDHDADYYFDYNVVGGRDGEGGLFHQIEDKSQLSTELVGKQLY